MTLVKGKYKTRLDKCHSILYTVSEVTNMVKQHEKLRVSYRFDAETVKRLQAAQECATPLFNGRSMTWLLEYAVERCYGSLLEPAPATNGSKS